MSMSIIYGNTAGAFVHEVGCHVSYLLHYRRNVDDLRNIVNDLKCFQADINFKVRLAVEKGELIDQVIERWLRGAEKILIETSALSGETAEITSCFKSTLRCRYRYRLGKQAKKNFAIIRELIGEATSLTTVSTSYFASTQSALNQVIEALKNDDINLIGVFGIGGAGKTTLMKELSDHVVKMRIFDEVVMVMVSPDPRHEDIQAEIAEKLNMKMEESTIDARASRLYSRLCQSKILLILDDVWHRLPLFELGIPSGDDQKGCKVVFTSRSKNVMECQVGIELAVLSKEDSWELFKMSVGDNLDSDALREVSEKIVSQCGGLPLAIVTMASALRGKNHEIWTAAAHQLSVSMFDNSILYSLKVSYDSLQRESQLCFLMCSVFPGGQKISIDELLKYALGEEIFEGIHSLEEARVRLCEVVDTLRSSCMLVDGENDGDIMMQNVVRDFAIKHGSKDANGFMVKSGIGLKEWPSIQNNDNCLRISLMRNELSELPERIECPRLMTLSLASNKSLKKISNDIFRDTKALVTLDMSHTCISSLPASLSCLKSLRTLSLDWCPELDDVSVIGMLKSLVILSLEGCCIQKLPAALGKLTNLKLLNLSNARSLEVIPSKVISSLTSLEEFHMQNSFSKWDIGTLGFRRKASLAEVGSLCGLTALNLDIKDVRWLSIDIPSPWEKLIKFSINASKRKNFCTENVYSRTMCLSTRSSSHPLADWVRKLLSKADALTLLECEGPENVTVKEEVCNLKKICIRECLEMEYVVAVNEQNTLVLLPQMEKLELYSVPMMKAICNGPLSERSFEKLLSLKVENGDKFENILPSKLLTRLNKLGEIRISDCRYLMEVFNSEELVESEAILPGLKNICLTRLPNLQSVWKGAIPPDSIQSLKVVAIYSCARLGFILSWDMALRVQLLEEITICDCEDMVEIIVPEEEEILETEIQLSPGNLRSLQIAVFSNVRKICISECPKLKVLFSVQIVRGLLELQELHIWKCAYIEQLFPEEGQEASEVVLPNLKFLTLHHLDKFSNFFRQENQKLILRWPSLEELVIRDCPRLKRIPFGQHSAPKLQEFSADDGWFEALKWEYEEEGVKPRLQSLRFWEVDEESMDDYEDTNKNDSDGGDFDQEGK